jgi:tRNA-dihydrouridine synthase B
VDLIRPLRIGGLELASNLCLAPMAGFTNLPYRLIVREVGGCGLVAAEMVAALASPTIAQNHRRVAAIASSPAERPVAMQIYGRDPAACAGLARRMVAAGADVIDLNCGCPVRKARQAGCGVALMRDPGQVARIVAALRLAVAGPVTVKLRLGIDQDNVNAVTVARAAVDAGADALTVHARTGESKRGMEVDLDGLAAVVAAVRVPVIGNGSLHTAAAIRAAAATGVAGYAIGLAACDDPWIFRRLADELAGRIPTPPTLAERHRICRRHLGLVLDQYGESAGSVIMRKYAGFFCRGLPGIRELRQRAHHLADRHGWEALIDGFFTDLARRGAGGAEEGAEG